MNTVILFKFTVVWILCSELVAISFFEYKDSNSGQITSPGYPGKYPNNVNYTWIIRTGSHSANVTFRIIEMNIRRWSPCDDYLEIVEIEYNYFSPFNRCGHFENVSIIGRGKKIRVSFISDKRMTDRGFNLTWRVSLPPTKALPETQVTTQKMLTTTTKYTVRTTSKKLDVKTTALKQKTTTPTSSQAWNTMQTLFTSTSGTTESTTEDTTTYKYISSTTFTTPLPESPSTVKNTGRTASPPIPSELPSSLFKQYSETPPKRSRTLTLSSTTRSSSVKLTTLDFNATTQTEDQNTFDIHIVYLIIGSVVFEFFLLVVACVSIYRCRNKGRSLQKNQCQQKRDEGARKFTNGAYWKSAHVYETIPVDAVCGLETCQEETNEEIDQQATLYDKCWRNEQDRTQTAMEEYSRDNSHTYDACERFYFTLQESHPNAQSATPTSTQRDSTNFYHTLDNSGLPK